MTTERPRRPTLKLKFPPPLPPPPAAKPAQAPAPTPGYMPTRRRAVAPPPPPPGWKCKPCGSSFDPPPELADDESVRCPSCNARLGRAADFRADPPVLEKLRARQVKR